MCEHMVDMINPGADTRANCFTEAESNLSKYCLLSGRVLSEAVAITEYIW